MTILKKLKPGIPKQGLLYIATLVWAFVSFRILFIGYEDIIENTSLYWVFIPTGALLAIPFFKFLFLRVANKHIDRILRVESERPCLFSFFDIKGYLIMAFMIALGISAQKARFIPHSYLGIFYISLGFSLFFSALHFLVSGIRYKKLILLERNNA